MKTFEVPCSWEMYGKMKVDAESMEEAIKIAESSESGLPHGSYVTDSFRVDYDIISDEEQ